MLKTTHHELATDTKVLWIVVKQNLIWLLNDRSDGAESVDILINAARLPFSNLANLAINSDELDVLHLGELAHQQQKVDCYLLDAEDVNLIHLGASDSFTKGDWHQLRHIVPVVDYALFEIMTKALQFSYFHQTHRYCGQCGRIMQRVKWEVANHCYHCQHRCYPRLSPCIIVAITRENKGKREILLAKGVKSSTGKFSVLAGFVEPGETLEHAVSREVFEEVGIEITNIQYFNSQPWPFPHNLMIGFVADYAAGALNIDKKEIAEAAWFDLEQLPDVPRTYSISGKLIEYVAQKYKADSQA